MKESKCIARRSQGSKCIVPGCTDYTTKRQRLPNPDREAYRFKKWLKIIRRKDLLQQDPIQVYKLKRICKRHFSSPCFLPNHPSQKLKCNALPDSYLPDSETDTGDSSLDEDDAIINDDEMIETLFDPNTPFDFGIGEAVEIDFAQASVYCEAIFHDIKLALLQMAVGRNKVENIKRAVNLIKHAKDKGSNLVVLPECFNSPYGTKYFKDFAEEIPSGETCTALSNAAKENRVFLVGGSIPEKDGSKLYNTCTVWNPEGSLVGKFRKVHLFDIHLPEIKFKESETLSPGDSFCVVDIGPCKIGVGICYDLRFVEFASVYKDLGVDILVYPGAFNMTTGPLHWELLLRARAVDNQMFVAACCGARDQNADYVAWGHSMVVDPWGKILTSAGAEETTLFSNIDLDVCKQIRQQIPIRQQKRPDMYQLTYKKLECSL